MLNILLQVFGSCCIILKLLFNYCLYAQQLIVKQNETKE